MESYGLHELKVNFLNVKEGDSYFLINLVGKCIEKFRKAFILLEEGSGRLVLENIIHMHTSKPQISKSFDLRLPWNEASYKRVSFHNSYHEKQTFRPRCDKVSFMEIRDEQITLNAGETGFISLKFLPQVHPCQEQLYVFIMNQLNLMEECFCINAIFE